MDEHTRPAAAPTGSQMPDPSGDDIAAAQTVETGIPYAQGLAYVWGRQDAGDTRISSVAFATTYALRRGKLGNAPCLETAYREYIATGAITTGWYR